MNILKFEDALTMSSREIAELTGKDHSHVMRDIRDIVVQMEQNPDLDFACKSSTYVGLNGQAYPQYELDKDSTYCLIAGYSAVLRMKIIKRWQELEQQVEKPRLPQTYLEALKELVAVTEVAEQQAKKIEQDKPLVTFAETVTNSTDCIAVGDLAKVVSDQNIKIGRNKLFQWLRDNEYLGSDNKPYQKYVDQGLFNLIEQTYKTPYGDKISFKTLVTGKGQITIVEKLREIFGEN